MGIHAVTGAFGYSGRYIAERLLAQGEQVITLTNSTGRDSPLAGRIPVHPFRFDDPDALARALEGVEVLYNTYWVRFNHRLFQHADAVANTLRLFAAAQRAGVKRVVHVSITNPDETSPLEYFAGKGRLERGLRESGLSYAILRPTVLFGREDILINNIAWALRHLPVFGMFGDGAYRLQPIHVDDLAGLAVRAGAQRSDQIIEAIGPETYTYRELAARTAWAIGVRRPIVPMPKRLAWLAGQAIGTLMGDVMITWPEVLGLTAGLLYVDAPPAGTTRLSEWMDRHRATLGLHYTSELARRRDRLSAYSSN